MSDLQRYSLIKTKIPREFILLQGKGCIWKKCTYCDYHSDVSDDPFKVNKPIIEQLNGEYGVLDVINSGSAMELDGKTLSLLQDKVEDLKINTLWFEAHWVYHKKLNEFSKFFPATKVKYRIGIETFDANLRNSWNKGIPNDLQVKNITKYFKGVCLLCCIEGQTKEIILNDINIALNNFEYFSVNVFNENSTNIKRDNKLFEWFKNDVAPKLENEDRVEVLMNNTDLGIG